VAKVEFRSFLAPAAEISALRSGQIDILDNLPVPESVPSLTSVGAGCPMTICARVVQMMGAFSVAKTNLVREPVALPGPARTLLPTLAEHVRDEA
jgi:hypothetical protein